MDDHGDHEPRTPNASAAPAARRPHPVPVSSEPRAPAPAATARPSAADRGPSAAGRAVAQATARTRQPPISAIRGNIVHNVGDAWAIYRLGPRHHLRPAREGNLAPHALLTALGPALDADFSLLRIARRESGPARTYLSVRLTAGRPLTDRLLADLPLYRALTRPTPDATGPTPVREPGPETLRATEASVQNRLATVVDCAPVAADELRSMVFHRLTGVLDTASVDDANPDMPAHPASRLGVEERSVHVATDHGDSHQALLCLDPHPAVPPTETAPEAVFASLDALDFPVDAAIWVRHTRSDDTARRARRRLTARPNTLPSRGHRPMLRISVSLAVAANDPGELDGRVASVRQVFDPVKLHRPRGRQLPLLFAHLPGQPAPLSDFDSRVSAAATIGEGATRPADSGPDHAALSRSRARAARLLAASRPAS